MKRSFLPVIVIGVTSLLMQVCGLRQLLSIFSGNELDIGITLSVWLISVGAGSLIGARIRFRHAFAASFLAVGFMSQPSVLIINLIRPVFSIGPGETIPLVTTLASTVISLLPLCLLIGVQFPLAVSHHRGDAARVYGLEAAGAFLGGTLFTFILSGRIDVFALTAALGIINILTGIVLMRKKSMLVLLLVPLAWHVTTTGGTAGYQWQGFDLVTRVESKYGEITVLKNRDQLNVYTSGKLHYSYPDTQTEELKAHLPLSVHPGPADILIIGGSPAVVRELLKYPVSRIDFVEADPRLIEVSFSLLDARDREMLRDPRLRVVSRDARDFIMQMRFTGYDLVILNLPEPSTANINRYYTTGFFESVRTVMKKDAVLSLTLPVSSGYISRRLQTANGSIYNSLRKIFPYTALSSEEYGYLFASGSPLDTSPEKVRAHFLQQAVSTNFFQPYIIDDAFSDLKVSMVTKRLMAVAEVNTDMKPVAYRYNLMLWAETHGGRALNSLLEAGHMTLAISFLAVFLLLTAGLWGKRQAVLFSVFTTGYAAMAFSVVIILAYQSLYGYIYEMIGLLSATFMLGMAIGASGVKAVVRPLRSLKLLELFMILLFTSAVFLLREELLFYLLNTLCGLAAGMQFATSLLCMKDHEMSAVAGRLYAIDLAGSFLGALLAAVLLIPLIGVQNMLLSLVSLKAVSLLLLISIRQETSVQ